MKIIFVEAEIFIYSKKGIYLLKKILERTGGKLVLFSTVLSPYVRKTLTKNGIELYDVTHHLRAYGNGIERGIDIQEWINSQSDISNMIIISNHVDMCHLKPYLVHVNDDKGITVGTVFKAIRMLKKPFEYKMKEVLHDIRKQF